MQTLLKFGKGNAKLGKSVHTFSLPAGHTCPFAKDCLAKVDPKTGKLQDGKHQQFRCFSAAAEAQYTETRNARWYNLKALKAAKTTKGMAALIKASLPKNAKTIRIHVSGDYFNPSYFKAWAKVAKETPAVTFYGYTKSLPYWAENQDLVPNNLILTASDGGTRDHLSRENALRRATVVFTTKEAKKKQLKIDHTDALAQKHGPNFALLLHGVQAKGSKASQALQQLKAQGHTGYSRK